MTLAERNAERQKDDTPPRHRGGGGPVRQLELGNKGLLVIFFSLVVVCALFFSFGYTIGRHAIPATFALGSAPPVTTAKPSSGLGTVPAPASGVEPPNPNQLSAAETNQTPATLTPPAPTTTSTPQAANLNSAGAAAPAGPPANLQGVFQVQVFSGTQTDAQSLTAALKAKGYPAAVVAPAAEQTDGQYHVVVGPYLTRAEAEAMRSRLTADGYDASISGQP